MPPEMAVSMRHTKLKAEEAALIAGELTKPSWESRNEGIHERVSFEDTIWGFDLAGGSYYKTPLRVTYVKPDSRAEKAGIRAGDKLLRINGIDTTTLTIQEAHDIIVKSGLHLALNVTAPEDLTDAYYCYEDPIDDAYEAEQERLRAEEAARRRPIHARVSSFWSLQWPWVSKRRIIWRESNCYLVPSKYEEKHKDKFPPRPMIRREEDIVLDNVTSGRRPSNVGKDRKIIRSKSYEGVTIDENADEDEKDEVEVNENTPAKEQENVNKTESLQNGDVNESDTDTDANSVIVNEQYSVKESLVNGKVDDNNNVMEKDGVNIEELNHDDNLGVEQGENNPQVVLADENEESKDENSVVNNHDEILDQVLNGGDKISKVEEDDIIESVLKENVHEINNSEPTNER